MIRAILLFLMLGACALTPMRETPTRAVIADSTLPPMKSFSMQRPQAPHVSNLDLVADFQELHFQLESGRPLSTFTRFETPMRVTVTGKPPASLASDLRQLLVSLRNEAGIDIRATSGADANIVIEAVSRADIRRILPQAACFVIPNVSSLAEFRRARRAPRTNWVTLTERTRMAIFLPYDASPQEVRDCLHEELAQAIGPLNDLYRLTDSVFNDDNVHTVLTGYDMMILRASYAPELQSGMSQAQVAARLPALFARINPKGASYAPQRLSPTPRSWISAVQTALGPGASAQARRSAVNAALRIAQQEGWTDHRTAFSHYIAGRMIQGFDPDLSQRHYLTALALYDQTPGTELHRAYLVTHMAANAITRGDSVAALNLLGPAIPVARNAENAALLATLQLLQAEAYTLEGRADQARTVRLDSLGWARYGFGADWAVRSKLREIASLNPLRQGEGEPA